MTQTCNCLGNKKTNSTYSGDFVGPFSVIIIVFGAFLRSQTGYTMLIWTPFTNLIFTLLFLFDHFDRSTRWKVPRSDAQLIAEFVLHLELGTGEHFDLKYN